MKETHQMREKTLSQSGTEEAGVEPSASEAGEDFIADDDADLGPLAPVLAGTKRPIICQFTGSYNDCGHLQNMTKAAKARRKCRPQKHSDGLHSLPKTCELITTDHEIMMSLERNIVML